MKKVIAFLIPVILFLSVKQGPAGTRQEFLPGRVSLINYSDKPVYATAANIPADKIYRSLGLPEGTPLQGITEDGKTVPVLPGHEIGVKVIRIYTSLKAGERIDLRLQKAGEWSNADRIAGAFFDAKTGTGKISNGILEMDFRDNIWNLSFAGTADTTDKKELTLLENSKLDIWIDSERRGRLMGIPPVKVREMGLIPANEAKLLRGEAFINQDGSAVLKLTRGFGGFAADVEWTEIYTLPAGQPVMTYQTLFSTSGNATRYLAFMELGGGMRGNYGKLLDGKMQFKYDNPTEPGRILLSGQENSFTRIGWRQEKCWVGIDSELGCGVGISTLKNITRNLPGSTVWAIGASYFARLLDTEQENFPYEFSAGKPLDLGFAFVATSGGTGIWHQTRRLFHDITSGKDPVTGNSYAIFLDNTPVKPGEVNALVCDNATRTLAGSGNRELAFLETDFQRNYRLTAKATGVTREKPVVIRAVSEENKTEPLTLLTLENQSEKEVDFTGLTGWAGERKSYYLEINRPEGSQLEKLILEPAGFPAPELNSPAEGVQITDLATFFRWKQVKGALDYEIQLSRDKGFSSPDLLNARSEVDWPYYLPADNELPEAGTWYWRVRATEPGRPGAWSAVRSFDMNNDHAKKPVIYTISPEKPLFTIEACRVKDLSKFTHTIPDDIKPYFAFNCSEKFNLIAYLKPLDGTGQNTFVRTHHPGPLSGWMPLADLEQVFQAYPNVIGIMGGETLSAHYHGGPGQTYLNRLLRLCGKYGRLFYDADGTYPDENKWEALYSKEGALMLEYKDYLIFAQKNNILHRQFVSQSSVMGLYLTGAITNQGAWEDGGWYWQQTGFRKLGDIRGQRGGAAQDMPRNFWNLNFLMGLSRGCAVFSFDGQTGTVQVPSGYKISEKGLPGNTNPGAHWTTEGELTPAFQSYMAPFIRGVIQHRMVPTKEQVLDQIRLAVWNDGVKAGPDADPYYFEWEGLYKGTYGFKSHGVIPGTLMEFFPNTGRYFYIPVFPQGKKELGHGIETLPLSQLVDPAAVRARFNKAYPDWYSGNALVNMVGDIISVLNSNENTDLTENYSVPLKDRGIFQNIAGKIEPHSYLMGKFEEGNRRLWLQANTEYPERDTELTLTCVSQPRVKILPEGAAKVNHWDQAAGILTLRLSHADGAVELEISQTP